MVDNISKSQLALRRAEKLDKEWQAAVRLMDKNKTPKEARPSYRVYKESKDNFNPEGTGYDYYTALNEGVTPFLNPDDGKYHWSTRAPITGQILKGIKHPTTQKAIEIDSDLGYYVGQNPDGRFYSQLVN